MQTAKQKYENTVLTLISFRLVVFHCNLSDNTLLKSGGAQYCSYRTNSQLLELLTR